MPKKIVEHVVIKGKRYIIRKGPRGGSYIIRKGRKNYFGKPTFPHAQKTLTSAQVRSALRKI